MTIVSSVTTIQVVFVAIAFALVWLKDVALPYGVAVPSPSKEERVTYAEIDPSNDSLVRDGSLSKVFQRMNGSDQEASSSSSSSLIDGPETVMIDHEGSIFVIPHRAQLLMLSDLQPTATTNDDKSSSTSTSMTAQVSVMKRDIGGGRPLGAAFTKDGEYLYIADAHIGLTRIRNPKLDPRARVEVVASHVPDPSTGRPSPILYANDVAIGPRTGKVYFTDSSDVAPPRTPDHKYDTLHAYFIDLFRGKGTGRLLAYDPSTDETKILATGFKYANAVAVDPDETFLFLVETNGIRLHVYHLQGPRQGNMDVVMGSQHMTGYLDGATCLPYMEPDGSITCYATVVSAILPIHKFLLKIPHPFDQWIRTVMMNVPRKFLPNIAKYGGLIEMKIRIDPSTGRVVRNDFRYLQDPAGNDVAIVSGVTYHDGKLFLGTLTNDYIALYTLPPNGSPQQQGQEQQHQNENENENEENRQPPTES